VRSRILAVVDHLADKHAAALVEADRDGIAHLRLVRGEAASLKPFFTLPGGDGVFGLHGG
jgi:hypothetical protein